MIDPLASSTCEDRRVEAMEAAERRENTMIAAAAIAMVIHFLHLHVVIGRRVVFEDQAVLWDVARDLRRGDVYQIDFPGQFYDSSLEAVPAALLGTLGLSDPTAFSVGMFLMALLPWSALAWALRRRDQPWLAAATLLLPIAMTVDNSAVRLLWVTAVPRQLAVLGVAAALGLRSSWRRWVVFVSLAGTGVLLDTSTVLLVGPVGVWLLAAERKAFSWRGALAGVVPPLVLALGRALNHDAHPAYDLHPSPGIEFARKPIEWHIRNPTRALREYGPEALTTPLLRTVAVLLAVGAVMVLVIRRGSLEVRLAAFTAASLLALFFSSIGSLRSAEFAVALPSVGRGLMALPFLAVVLVAMTGLSPRGQAAIAAGVGVLAIAGIGVRAVTDSPGDFVEEVMATGAIDLVELDLIEQRCEDLEEVMADHPDAVVLSWSSTTAWSCSALIEDAIGSTATVIFPIYERRTWELERVWDRGQLDWIVWGHGQDGCNFAPGMFTCELVANDIVVMGAPSRLTLAQVVPLVGLQLRPLPDGFPAN